MPRLQTPHFLYYELQRLIKLIYDKITLIYSVKNEYNPTSEVQNIGNGAFQIAPFPNAPFANGSFPNGGYSCLWAKITNNKEIPSMIREQSDLFWIILPSKHTCICDNFW